MVNDNMAWHGMGTGNGNTDDYEETCEKASASLSVVKLAVTYFLLPARILWNQKQTIFGIAKKKSTA